jgi:stage III sporulation protein AD
MLGAGVLMAVYLIGFVKNLEAYAAEWNSYLSGMKPYITIIWKAVGITYLCEFAAGISRDCGNSMIAAQIETGGKIAVLLLGMPVLGTLLETITNFL